jgi:hypothetical protein
MECVRVSRSEMVMIFSSSIIPLYLVGDVDLHLDYSEYFCIL